MCEFRDKHKLQIEMQHQLCILIFNRFRMRKGLAIMRFWNVKDSLYNSLIVLWQMTEHFWKNPITISYLSPLPRITLIIFVTLSFSNRITEISIILVDTLLFHFGILNVILDECINDMINSQIDNSSSFWNWTVFVYKIIFIAL